MHLVALSGPVTDYDGKESMLARDNCLYGVIGYDYMPLPALPNMNKKNYRIKKYIHFDNKTSIDKVESKIKSPCWVSRHGFYPFIHFQIKFKKYDKKTGIKKSKVRDIYYASHIDSFIYKYYGDKLNDLYNDVAQNLNISKVATAYRNNLHGMSNINFAKEVIEFIKQQQNAFIYVADFTKFFDRLDHKYLKEKLKFVLKEKSLPKDHYTLFKNITRFSYVDKDDIDRELKGKLTKEEIKRLKRYYDAEEFRAFKEKYLHVNENSFGIPQGAGISSVYSNIYLLEFDSKINEYIKQHNGIYRRYCDDLIIVIPVEGNIRNFNYKLHVNFISKIKDHVPNLEIQSDKTGNYFYTNNELLDIDEGLKKSKLDYLGFSFNGSHIKIREKSIFKFYSKAYRKVRICNRKSKAFGRKSYRKSLYQNYTHIGKKRSGHGNFLTYVSRAQKIFNDGSYTISFMERQVKNHWKRINARLEKP